MMGTTSPNISSLLYRQHHDSMSYGAEAFDGAGKEILFHVQLCSVLYSLRFRHVSQTSDGIKGARESALLKLNL
jgi:hypothetical protein